MNLFNFHKLKSLANKTTHKFNINIIILIIFVLIIMNCCSIIKKAQKENDKFAKKINNIFINTKKISIKQGEIIAKVLDSADYTLIDINNMDESEGGIFKWLKDDFYYPIQENIPGTGIVYFCNGLFIDKKYENQILKNLNKRNKLDKNSIEIKEIKKKLKVLQNILPDLKKISKKTSINYNYYFTDIRGIHLQSFYFDVPSFLPSELNLEIFANLNLYKFEPVINNPDKKNILLKELYISKAGEGWFEAFIIPVFSKTKYFQYGLTCINISINELDINIEKEPILLLSESMSLLAISKTAKNILNLKEIKDFDYVEQMKNNISFEDKLKLTYEKNDYIIQEIGKRIFLKEKIFDITISNIRYNIIVSDIPEVNFYLVRLVKK